MAPPVQILPVPMSSLPNPIVLPDADPFTPAMVHSGAVAHDEPSLRRAFRSFVEAAESLERSYASLQGEVSRLRSELDETQARLRREQALAEISALLAHEVRNPLGSLELFAGLLAESELDGERRQWVEHVQAGLRTLAATVNNVLHFHSCPPPERAPLDLGRLLEWARDFFRPVASRAGIVMSVENQLQSVELAADRHGLEQVFANLVLNAVGVMPGGGWIELRGARASDGRVAMITVADTGPGIAPANLPRIFEPGFSTRPGGAGLGLAVCRKIVEQHGGTISATSVAGSGARFTMTFPLVGKNCSSHTGSKVTNREEGAAA